MTFEVILANCYLDPNHINWVLRAFSFSLLRLIQSATLPKHVWRRSTAIRHGKNWCVILAVISVEVTLHSMHDCWQVELIRPCIWQKAVAQAAPIPIDWTALYQYLMRSVLHGWYNPVQDGTSLKEVKIRLHDKSSSTRKNKAISCKIGYQMTWNTANILSYLILHYFQWLWVIPSKQKFYLSLTTIFRTDFNVPKATV